MSNVIPQFTKGDRVRVMQTTTMEQLGLANKRGKVHLIFSEGAPYQKIIVQMDDGSGVRIFSNDSLMRIEPKEVAG